MNIFFTSDNHFYHKGILNLCKASRPANNLEELHSKMVERWNEQVGPYDTVYCLGDFSFGDSDQTIEILKQLNGLKHLIKGNHDHWITSMSSSYFQSIKDYYVLKLEKHRIAMMHYPIIRYDRMHYGAFHLHGHTHGDYQHPGRGMDVGIDTRTDLGLYTWDEIKALLLEKPIIKR